MIRRNFISSNRFNALYSRLSPCFTSKNSRHMTLGVENQRGCVTAYYLCKSLIIVLSYTNVIAVCYKLFIASYNPIHHIHH